MNCEDYRDWLQQRLDGENLAGPDVFQEHLTTCNGCRGLHAVLDRLTVGLQQMPRHTVPSGFAHCVTGRVLRQRRQRRFVKFAAVAASLAALVLLVPLVRTFFQPAKAPDPLPQVVQVLPAPHPEPAIPSLRDRVAEMGDAVASLTRRTADETVEQGRLLLPARSAFDVFDTPPLEPPVGPLREAGQGMTVSLGPVTNSAKRAWDLLLREVPQVPMDRE